MNLEEYKKQISNLQVDEQKMQDLCLRQIALGNIEESITGYPSKDKPWLKFYTEDKILEDAPKDILYNVLYENNKDHLDEIAIEYLGRKITYKELFEKIESTAKAFKQMGVEAGDIVTICSITTPEIIYSFYALNKIGAISNMVDLRYTKKSIEQNLCEVHSKVLITLDMLYPKIKDIIDNTNVTNVITITPTNSSPTAVKLGADLIARLQKTKIVLPQNSKYIDWNTFINNGSVVTSIETVQYQENVPAAIVHTGGTTGVPKGVLLTNENFNNASLQIKNSNVNAYRGYRFLNIMPPFIAYGIVLGLHTPISLGWHTIVIPKFDAEKFAELLNKHKPNGIMGVPAYWENVMKSKLMKNKDLSYIKNILLGGDRIKAEFEKKLEAFLVEHNCYAGVGKGYSMTEASACATFSTPTANELDSVGIPLVKTSIGIFEPNTTTELTYGKVGEVCIKTPTMMLGYYDRQEDTDMVKVMHQDGYWIHSGDLGCINENGIVFIKDRMKRMIIRSGFKVFPSEIENLFLSHYAVESCAVVGIPDEVDVTAPKVHIVLKQEYKGDIEKIKRELMEMFDESHLPPYFKPVDYKFRDNLPLTDVGKIDFISLQNEETLEKPSVLVKK